MEAVAQKLDETVALLVSQGTTTFLSGVRAGFDQLAALAILKAREQDPSIKLIMVLPCTGQDEGWSETDRKTYRLILGDADHIFYATDTPYANGCMEAWGRCLVGRSSVLVAYMEQGQGDTGETVSLAREHGLKVINLAER
jgi:uncharacterized phage-like protein YoqJ